MTLDELAIKHGTDKGTISQFPSTHGYAPMYDKLFSKWRDKSIKMLEIGICMEYTRGGQSVNMWYEYFTNATICTFDYVDMKHIENDRVFFFQGDQGDRNDLISMYSHFGSSQFDFILEDGSHNHHHQMISLGHLFKYVKSKGYYILEDMSIPDHEVCCIRNDDTYKIIKSFIDTGKIVSEHMTDEEINYLQKNIKDIEILHDIQDAYATAIITKK